MLRPVLLLVLLAALTAPASAEESERVVLQGARATVFAPGAGFTKRTETPAAGQWLVAWTRTSDGLELVARVFPIKDIDDPKPALVHALQTLGRVRGYAGVGIPSIEATPRFGRGAADATFQAVIDGKGRSGHCRLLRPSAHTWAFAFGVPGADASAADDALIKRFVSSLEPMDPGFLFRPFRDEAQLAQVVTPRGVKPPLTYADALAVIGAVETSRRMRFALATRVRLLRTLAFEIAGTPEVRAVYAEAAQSVREAEALEPAACVKAMAAVGAGILADWERRKTDPDGIAAVLANHVRVAEKPAFEGGPPATALAADIEVRAFLATIADDQPRPPDPEAASDVEGRFGSLSEADRDGIRRAAATWMVLRYAWDQATRGNRTAFRLAVARALAPEPPAADASGHALYAWMHQGRSAERSAAISEHAMRLSADDVAGLIRVLGVENPGYRLGW